uniref:Leucine-rich repeat-containing protein 14 n=1 Tax=Daphnia magna TaxID=35525 RepID=A0A0P6EMT9_9CRUS
MEATANTPFKLPLWSEWAIQVKEKQKKCSKCTTTIPDLKELAIRSLITYLKQKSKCHEIQKILQDNHMPSALYVDVACILFASKQWGALRSLVSYWPFEAFHLSRIINITCPQCWLAFLDSDDTEDPEKEGGDTERQLFRKVFKHVLDGFFFVMKKTLENEGQASSLRVLDLTLETSQEIRSFMWEDEFRRLGRRVTKILDVCILAGLHKKIQSSKKLAMKHKNSWTAKRPLVTLEVKDVFDYWEPDAISSLHSCEPTFENSNFDISTWDMNAEVSAWSAAQSSLASVDKNCDEAYCQQGKSPEIGVWNGNALDFNHLTDMPFFNITIDASISEKSNDILSWIQQRYDEFAPSSSPVSVTFRFLEINLHEERKLEALMDQVPEHVIGLKFVEICERRSVLTLSSHIDHFSSVSYLDLGSCAFNLADHSQAVESMSVAFSHLRCLERLSLAHNQIAGCLADLLIPLQHGLELLDLTSCRLNDDDLSYLGESAHCRTLRSLSLAANELGLQWGKVIPLLDQIGKRSSLQILDLSSNDFVESQLLVLSRTTLGPLSSLALFDLSWHELSLASLISIVELLASKTNLRTFCLSTPIDMLENGYDHSDSWQRFVNLTEALTAKHREGNLRPSLTLHWCLM